MIKSKSWDWSKNEDNKWLIPAMESCYLIEAWKSRGFTKFLDLGCGLGRHSIYFAQNSFDVNAVDLSEYAVNHLREWAEREKLALTAQICDMLALPFADNSFDCIIAYNVIYHTDTPGFIKSLDEITRVLKPQGELFITLISKNTWSFQNADSYKKVDDNTILRDEHDTERNMAHFYVDIKDIKSYFEGFDYVRLPIEQTEYNMEKPELYSKHFVMLVKKKTIKK